MYGRKKTYITVEQFEAYKLQGVHYEGYVIGMGYAYCQPINVSPPHHQLNYPAHPWVVPDFMSYYSTCWVQCIDQSQQLIMESYGSSMEYLHEMIMREFGDRYYIHMGHGKIIEVVKDKSEISIEYSSTGEMARLKVTVKDFLNSAEYSTEINMEDFALVFQNPCEQPYLANHGFITIDQHPGSYLYSLGAEEIIGGFGTYYGLRSSIPHNELFWRQKNGKWSSRPATRNNYVYNRSYELKGVKLSGLKVASRGLGVASGALLVYDVASTGQLKASHGVNAVMIGISFSGVGAIVAGVWFITDFGTGLLTGKSISERLDEKAGTYELWETK